MSVWGKVILCYSIGIAIGLVLFFLEKKLNDLSRNIKERNKDDVNDAFKNANIVETKDWRDKFKR